MTPEWFEALLRPELTDLRAYVPTPAPEGALRLDANESPYDLSPEDKDSLSRCLSSIAFNRYPDARATRLRELVADTYGAHPDEIVLGCGSDEAISLITATLSHSPLGKPLGSVMFPDPSFVMYRHNAALQGLRSLPIALDPAWDLDLNEILRQITLELPSVIFLPSPNNPTGKLFSLDRIEAVARHATRSLVVLDEAYAPFSGVSYRSLRKDHPHVAQLQTLSKIGLAAARVGWVILPRALAQELDKLRQPYNLSTLSQHAAIAALSFLKPSLDAHVRSVISSRNILYEALSRIDGLSVTPSDANFLWIQLPSPARDITHRLRDRGVLVRSFHSHSPRLSRAIRVTVGTPPECERFTSALREVL